MSNRKYDPALKEEILTAVQVHGVSIKKAAQDFSVPAHSIYSWIREKRYAGKTETSSVIREAAEQELVRLRQENQQLRLEKEILEKATAYFAKIKK